MKVKVKKPAGSVGEMRTASGRKGNPRGMYRVETLYYPANHPRTLYKQQKRMKKLMAQA